MSLPQQAPKQKENALVHAFKKATFPAWKVWRHLSASGRSLPQFIIIGTQKGGTTSLFEYLMQHPAAVPPLKKEIKYFDLNYEKGLAWYQGHFPFTYKMRNKGSFTGESSPYILFHPLAPQRIAYDLPGVKLIVLLRNPVERAFSHYQMNVRTGRETLSFPQALDREEERLNGARERVIRNDHKAIHRYITFSYLAKGRYAEQLSLWYSHFSKPQILVLKSEDLFTDPAVVVGRVLAFLNVPGRLPGKFDVYNAGTYSGEMPALSREFLENYFAIHNETLYQLVDGTIRW